MTYRALDRRVAFAAGRLCVEGLGTGDVLALYRAQDLRSLVLILAALRAGLIVVPVSTRQPAGAVPALLDRVGAGAVVADPEGGWGSRTVLSAEALTTGEADPREAPLWTLDRPATAVFTSGSTGEPKAALHTLGNHVWSARGWRERTPVRGWGPGDRWLLDLPLAHVGGLAVLLRCVLAGAAVVLPEQGAPVAETARRFGVTHASLVATQLRRALDAPDADALAGLRLILLGGSAIPAALLAEAHRRGIPVATSYGLTEAASTVTATAPGAPPEALATAGAVLPHREVRLSSEGEILVRGRTQFAGYLGPAGLERPFDAAGWFATGDLGAWAEVGGQRMLRVVGRLGNRFISGGENVQPEAVEAALLRQPGVRQAVVVAVTDEEFGERPAAFVDAEAWRPGTWRRVIAAELPRFAIPTAFHPWPEGEDGLKPSRARLRERAERLRKQGSAR